MNKKGISINVATAIVCGIIGMAIIIVLNADNIAVDDWDYGSPPEEAAHISKLGVVNITSGPFVNRYIPISNRYGVITGVRDPYNMVYIELHNGTLTTAYSPDKEFCENNLMNKIPSDSYDIFTCVDGNNEIHTYAPVIDGVTNIWTVGSQEYKTKFISEETELGGLLWFN